MLKNGRSKASWNLHFFGCSCCNSKRRRRKVKHTERRRERQAWLKDQALK